MLFNFLRLTVPAAIAGFFLVTACSNKPKMDSGAGDRSSELEEARRAAEQAEQEAHELRMEKMQKNGES